MSNDTGEKAKITAEILRGDAVPETVVEQDRKKFSKEANIVTGIFGLLIASILLIWYLWDPEYLSNESDLVYDLGLIGGIMMLLQFLYSARKRFPKLRQWGELKVWFGIHVFVGLAAPTIIIIHSQFEIASINGGVAFFSMLIVAVSGMVGRYLYSQVSFDLANERLALKNLHSVLQEKVLNSKPELSDQIQHLLKNFMVTSFASPKNVVYAFWVAFMVRIRAKYLYLQICHLRPASSASQEGTVALKLWGDHATFTSVEKKIIKAYLGLLSKLARHNAVKHLYSFWRIGHIPFLYLLLISGIFHVIAVHMY